MPYPLGQGGWEDPFSTPNLLFSEDELAFDSPCLAWASRPYPPVSLGTLDSSEVPTSRAPDPPSGQTGRIASQDELTGFRALERSGNTGLSPSYRLRACRVTEKVRPAGAQAFCHFSGGIRADERSPTPLRDLLQDSAGRHEALSPDSLESPAVLRANGGFPAADQRAASVTANVASLADNRPGRPGGLDSQACDHLAPSPRSTHFSALGMLDSRCDSLAFPAVPIELRPEKSFFSN